MRKVKGLQSVTFTSRPGMQGRKIDMNRITQEVNEETLRSSEEQASKGNASGVVELPMTLRIEGKDMPNITLIDLPGIKYTKEVMTQCFCTLESMRDVCFIVNRVRKESRL